MHPRGFRSPALSSQRPYPEGGPHYLLACALSFIPFLIGGSLSAMPSLTEQTEEQLKGYAAQQDAISSIMMRFVESLEKIETKVGVLEKGGDSQIVELQRQIENLAFNIQGHAGKGVEKTDEEAPAVKEITPPPSPAKEERVSLHPSGEYSVVSVVARNRWNLLWPLSRVSLALCYGLDNFWLFQPLGR